MDPDVALARIRESIIRINRSPQFVHHDDAMLVVEYFEALDEWLCKGGFLPEAWQTEKTT